MSFRFLPTPPLGRLPLPPRAGAVYSVVVSAAFRNALIGLACAALMSVASAQTPPRRSPATLIPPTYFGMHFHRADQGTVWPGREIGAWRLWDANVIWADIEPQPEQWAFSRLDRYVGMAALARTELLYPFGMTPQWASARPTEKGVYRPAGDKAEPARPADWERMVRTVARRYKGRIRGYELWNEVNAGMGFFTGSPEALLGLQKAAYRIVKEEDPAALFISPSVVGEADHLIGWFDNYLALGAAAYADVIAYHFYQPSQPPEAIVGLVDKVRASMARHGAAGKPLWNTESGYRMAPGKDGALAADPKWPLLSPPQAEAYVARALVLGWWAGIDRFYWYAWDNGELGLVDGRGGVTPAGRAYLATARWLVGARLMSCQRSAPVWICGLERGGRNAWLVWNEKDEAMQWPALALPAAKAAETLAGTVEPIGQTRLVKVDGRPVLLRDSDVAWSGQVK